MSAKPDSKNFTRKTIAQEVTFKGRGIHTNQESRIICRPVKKAGTGILLRRGKESMVANLTNADGLKSERRTVLIGPKGETFEQLEHILAALGAMGITDLELEMTALEPPFMGGGSKEFMDGFLHAGTHDLKGKLTPLIITKPFVFKDGDAELVATPHQGLRLSAFVEFPGTIVGSMGYSLELTADSFSKEVAPARTFAKKADLEYLKSNGLAQGGNLENAVVFDENEYLNKSLHFKNEVVRHKVIDLLGDLTLIGRPLVGHFWAWRAGHRSHVLFAKALESEFATE